MSTDLELLYVPARDPAYSGLLTPLRDALEKHAREGLEALDAMPDDAKESFAWDSAEDVIRACDQNWLPSIRGDVEHALWDARWARNGYDTWSKRDRETQIACLEKLLKAVTRMIGTIRVIEGREADEISRLRQSA